MVLQQRYGVYEGTEDAYLDEAPSYQQDNNFGGAVDLSVKYDGGYSDCLLIKFNLTGQIPPHQRILSSTLALYYNDAANMGGSDDAITIKPFRVNGGKSWYENSGDNLNGQGVNFLYRDQNMQQPWSSGAAWNDCTDDGNGTAKIEGSNGSVPGAIRPGAPVDFNVLPTVALWYGTDNNGLENNGVLLVAVGNEGGGDIKYGRFDSSEKFSYNWYNNPKLTITFEGALAPLAEAAGPYACPCFGDVQLNGSGSNDPDGGSIQSWLWDLDGDSDYDDATGATPTLTFDYLYYTLHLPVGDNEIRLKVRDDENEWSLNPDTALLTLADPTVSADDRTALLPPTVITVAPSPFADVCRIHYRLPSERQIRVVILDIAGRTVRNLTVGRREAPGEHALSWDGRGDLGQMLPSGIYLARVLTPIGESSVRIALIR
jgi:hypothetical protein